MNSPAEIPFKNVILLDRLSGTAVYLQIAHQMINAIQRGVLVSGVKLPGTRPLAEMLGVHRKTVVAAYNELDAQGWIEILPNSGTFVAKRIQVGDLVTLPFDTKNLVSYPKQAGYSFERSMLLDRPVSLSKVELEFTDGLPDVRLAPMERLAKAYSSVLKRKNNRKYLSYSHVEGNIYFRGKLADYLNNTRGLHIGSNNIITTRGIQMGIYLASMLLIKKGDHVVVGNLSYYVANMIFQQAGAQIASVPVDDQGISVEAVRKLCETTRIRMLYITPHHHYPTTVTLSAERRVELLNLSIQYRFIILEDDHDYDFHYNSSPVLPLASADGAGMVVYVGSFCKAMAPGLRAGYIVAPENLILELGKLRRIIDRQGDLMMEQALGELLDEGEIQRHIKKAQKVYHHRRDLFGELLENHLSNFLTFKTPPGGLAIWTEWRKDINLMRISKACLKQNLHLPQTLLFQTENLSAMRLGFGSMDENELEESIHVLKNVLEKNV
ncbi:aminotransferase-like domain-containing protein [Dyadobacter arcticus]|uniref:GntR family transcriptional regulator/MocR family aminotransferase n=1 Tax=Dyadobacter arcticus TaxID=1078754 RepID=A0ABX0US93_9BACT|nr:PLP-dependent aminotransferase family protein [Dyadobacter arcticus]NIJ55288.1 GntR family transcriptional regulator/MocR family aminotransferase [Dyadobacter arcticus]